MQEYWWWWGLAVLLGMFEMLTAGFYLLVLALGFAAGGLTAWLGAGIPVQVLATAAVSVAGWAALRRWGPRRRRDGTDVGRDVLLDIGERVQVDRWSSDRRTQVSYRGAQWAAELDPTESGAPAPGPHLIRRIDGNRLILTRAPLADAPTH